MIYLISDWHFCHQRDFIYKPRGFNSPEEMNAAIIERHNAIVKPEDDVYCLGDCIMNNNEEGIKCINKLKGKIHVICGNHETKTKIELYKKCKNMAFFHSLTEENYDAIEKLISSELGES